MSDTPETDAVAFAGDFDGQGDDEVVFANLARRFERERNKAEAGWLECRNFAQRIVDERDRYKSNVEVITKERDEARNIARWLDDYEAMEALLCEMQGLRDELVDVKRERDQWRIQCEQAEMALQNIATGSNCRECDGEDQARIAKDVINTASNL